ncbi:acyltransferase family protein [Promicromonospora sp. MS192]|uniref:acyltransferase family protein n=1 Tax=Promicromonospora sp. MS192 TaxID=3412684 RepID=UPI003C30CDB4
MPALTDSAAPPPRTKRARMGVLDGLRFLAAAAVMLFHYTALGNPSWGVPPTQVFPGLSDLTAFGAFGVDLFFVISGFVILLTAWGRDVRSYAISRITRLYPAYWVAVLLTGFLLLVLWPDRRDDVELTTVGVNLTMLQSAFGMPHVDGVYWTLWVELRFYVLVGVLLVVGLTGARVLAFAALWPAAGAMAHEAGLDLVANLLVWDYAPLFAGGMALFLLTKDRRSLIAWLVLAENVILGAAWSGRETANIIVSNTGHAVPDALSAAAVAGSFALVALATLTRLRHVSAAWLTTAGALTYPLYLVHEYWGWWVIHLLHDALPRYVVLAAAVVVVLAMAWLIQRFVEKPLAPVLRDGLRGAFARLALIDPPTVRRGDATHGAGPGPDGRAGEAGAVQPAASEPPTTGAVPAVTGSSTGSSTGTVRETAGTAAR